MIVVGASVLANALTDDGRVGRAGRAELGRDTQWAAPEHCAVETFSAVRVRDRGRRISRSRAEDALRALASAAIDRVPTIWLRPRMWELREKGSGNDAAYVAAAEMLDCPRRDGRPTTRRGAGSAMRSVDRAAARALTRYRAIRSARVDPSVNGFRDQVQDHIRLTSIVSRPIADIADSCRRSPDATTNSGPATRSAAAQCTES